jgi:hypothetical protein
MTDKTKKPVIKMHIMRPYHPAPDRDYAQTRKKSAQDYGTAFS